VLGGWVHQAVERHDLREQPRPGGEAGRRQDLVQLEGAPHLMTHEEQALAKCRIGIDYPSPIVDHRQARDEYLALGKLQRTR